MDYQAAIAQLRAAKPDHLLLRILSMQDTPGNRLILSRELEKLAPEPVEAAPITVVDEEAEADEPTVDPVLTDLYRQQSKHFGERRKASNRFHDCETDRDRRKVSEEIQIIQRRIEFVRARIRQYKADGYVPDAPDKYDVPSDPIKLKDKQQSLRSSISRQRRIIAEAEREEGDGALENLAKHMAKLEDLKTHLQHVEEAIENRNL